MLSAHRIATAVLREVDVWLSDNHGLRGAGRLVLRIAPSGNSRFYFRQTKDGQRSTIALGPYSRTSREGHLTLGQARTLARELSASLPLPGVFRGVSPSAREAPPGPAVLPGEVEAPTPAIQFTLMDLCRSYVSDLQSRGRVTAKAVAHELERHVATTDIAGVPARDVTPEQITRLLRGMIQKGIGRTAGRIRTQLHAAYEASLNARLNPGASELLMDPLLTTNPVANISTLSDYSVPRSRVLNKAELREFWLRLMSSGRNAAQPVQARALRLALLLGGQRCEQLLRVRVEQVDFDNETILLLDPKGRRKVPREHRLPLLGDAAEEVRYLLQHARDVGSRYLFPGAKATSAVTPGPISRLVTQIRKEMVVAGTASGHFQFSDLRRTAETTLASLGVSKDVRAQLQSHGLGGVQARHYDRYEYMDEKRAALLLWEGHLRALLDPQK